MNFVRITMALGLVACTGGVFTSIPPALASSERTTAGEVVDPETNMVDRDKLKAFVLSARDYILGFTDYTQHVALLDEFREEGGDWNSGNMYIILLSREGIVVLHGEDRDAFGINIRDLEDDDGVKVFQRLLTAAGSTEDGGFANILGTIRPTRTTRTQRSAMPFGTSLRRLRIQSLSSAVSIRRFQSRAPAMVSSPIPPRSRRVTSWTGRL